MSIPTAGLQTNLVTWWTMPELFEENKEHPLPDNRFEKVCDWFSDDANTVSFIYAAYVLDILLMLLANNDIVSSNLASLTMLVMSVTAIFLFVISADVSTYLFLKSKQHRRIKSKTTDS